MNERTTWGPSEETYGGVPPAASAAAPGTLSGAAAPVKQGSLSVKGNVFMALKELKQYLDALVEQCRAFVDENVGHPTEAVKRAQPEMTPKCRGKWLHCWHYKRDDKSQLVIRMVNTDPSCKLCYEEQEVMICGRCGIEKFVSPRYDRGWA